MDAGLRLGIHALGEFFSGGKRRLLEHAEGSGHAMLDMGVPTLHDPLVFVDPASSFRHDAGPCLMAAEFAPGDEVLVRSGCERDDEQDQTQEGDWLQDRIFRADWREP